MNKRSSVLLIASIGAFVPLLLLQVLFVAEHPQFWYVGACWFALGVWLAMSRPFAFPASKPRRRTTRVLVTMAAIGSVLAGFLCSPGFAHFSSHFLVTGWLLGLLGFLPWTRVVAMASVAWIAWPVTSGFAEWFSLKLEFYARSAMTGILDYWDVKHFVSEGVIDLAEMKLDVSGANAAAEGVFLLLAFGVTLLVTRRSTLLPALITLGSIPVIWMLGRVLMLLVVVSTASLWGSNTLIVQEIWWIRLLAFLLNLAFLFMVYGGVHYLAEPVVTGDEAKRGSVLSLNRVLLWPLRLEPEIEPETDDDLEVESSFEPHAQLPNLKATEKASDPWNSSPLYYANLAMSGLAFLLGILAWIIPPAASAQLVREQADAFVTQVAAIQSPGMGVMDSSVAWTEEESEIRWTVVTPGGPASLRANFEFRDFNAKWSPGQPRMKRLVELADGTEWPCVEVIESTGEDSSVYQFNCAFDLDTGEVFAESRSLGLWFSDLGVQSLYGRLTGMKPVQLCNLELRMSAAAMLEPAKREEMAKAACTVFESVSTELSGKR